MTTPKEPIALEAYLMGLARGMAVFDPEMLEAAAAHIRRNEGTNRELAEEFRRLAAEAKANIDHWEFQTEHYQAVYRTRYQDFTQAAQMLEERLNG